MVVVVVYVVQLDAEWQMPKKNGCGDRKSTETVELLVGNILEMVEFAPLGVAPHHHGVFPCNSFVLTLKVSLFLKFGSNFHNALAFQNCAEPHAMSRIMTS